MGVDRRAVFVGVALVGLVSVGALAFTFQPGDDGTPLSATTQTSNDTDETTDTGAEPSDATTPVTAPPTTRPAGKPVVIAFGGDVHFESYLRSQLDANAAGMLAPIAPVLSLADLAVVNLETAVTERGEAVPKDYNFRAPTAALTALKSAGVDVASLANNHGLDYGPVGIDDALAASAETGLPIVGIGHNAAEAFTPFRATVNGQRIAIIGATQVLDSALISSWTATDTQGGLASAKEVARLVDEVKKARADSDTVVVFLHWGASGQTCPTGDQQSLAATLRDAGADVIVGGHSHRVEGAGWLGKAGVAYGLGNFIWYAKPGPSSESGVLLVRVAGRDVQAMEWVPAQIRNGVPRPLDGSEREQAVAAWNSYRVCTGLAAAPAS